MAFRRKGLEGGKCVSEDYSSLLRFSLEESVWFQRGQEVSELYSISLEPNVSAHQVEQYIILKGTLDLMGEYKPTEGTEQEEVEDPFQRYVSVIEQKDNQLFEFHQQFPVDITIPAERVREIDDLNVGVHTFDYKLLEKGNMQIKADLWIGGVYENLPDEPGQIEEEREETSHYQNEASPQQQQEPQPPLWDDVLDDKEESAEEIDVYTNAQSEHENEQIEAPLYRSNSVEEDNESYNEEDSAEIYLNTDQHFLNNNQDQDNHFYVEAKLSPRFHQQQMDHEEDDSVDESEQSEKFTPFVFEPEQLFTRDEREDFKQPFSIPYDNRFDEEPPELSDVSLFNTPSNREDESEYTNAIDQVEPSYREHVPTRSERVEVEEIKESKSRRPREETATNFYARKEYPSNTPNRENVNEDQMEGKTKSPLYDLFSEEEEIEQARVRVCIVQSGENIDILAERYNTSVQNIARMNGLELTSDLRAGQVIYIPEAAASYK